MKKQEKRIVALSVAVTLLGGWVTMPSYAMAGEEESGGECTPTKFYHCYMSWCTSHHPCSEEPGNGFSGCSNVPAGGGWYPQVQFVSFQCGA